MNIEGAGAGGAAVRAALRRDPPASCALSATRCGGGSTSGGSGQASVDYRPRPGLGRDWTARILFWAARGSWQASGITASLRLHSQYVPIPQFVLDGNY
jgi:hypothetical protein